MSHPASPISITTLAGRSSRMGSLKQHLRLDGRTFLQHILDRLETVAFALAASYFVGHPDDQEARALVEEWGGRWISNQDTDLGPLHSIRLACRSYRKPAPVLLWPVDHPLISISTLVSLLQSSRNRPDSIIVPSDGKRRGHPPLFPAWAWAEFFEAPLEEGTRWILQHHGSAVFHLCVADPGILLNLNTPEVLAAERSRRSPPAGLAPLG